MNDYTISVIQTKIDTLIGEQKASQKRIDDAQKIIDRENEVLKEINRKISELQKVVNSLLPKKDIKNDKTK